MKKTVAITLSLAIALGGCATSSKDIAPAYASPMQYQSYDCVQITAEIQRIQARTSLLGGRLDQAANNDKAIMGVALILFWPAAFALGGNKAQEAEYARLKGEYDALEQAAIQKRCAGTVAGSPAVAVAPAQAASASPAAALQSAFKVGDRLVYHNLDPISGSKLTEQTLTITRMESGRVEYNNGDLVTDATGNWASGSAIGHKLIGVTRPTYTGAFEWRGGVESMQDSRMKADVEVKVAGPSGFTAEGIALPATRLNLDGWTSGPAIPPSGVTPQKLTGHVLVDPASGVLLELSTQTNHPLLASRRVLMRKY